jgi:hypothetical protein
VRAKGRPPGRKRSAKLEVVTKALLAKLLVRLRAEATDHGRTGHLVVAAKELSEIGQLGPTRRIVLKLRRDTYFHMASAARNDFGEWLDKLCQTVLPEQLLWLAENLCEVNADFAWVESELEKSRSHAKAEILSCAGLVSTGRSEGVASWLIDWPDEISPGAIFSAVLGGRLDSTCTARVRTAIGDFVEEAFPKASKSGSDHARILIAKRGSFPQSPQSVLRDPLKFSAQESMKKHPDSSYRDICGHLDDRYDNECGQVPLPRKCRNHGHKTFVDSIDCVDCRKYMKSFLSRERAELGLPRPPKSKFPPQNKVTKLARVRN